MLNTKVVAGPITSLTDARYFAAREATWLLFELEAGADDFLEPQAMKAMREWVDGVQIVGAFHLAQASEIRDASAQWQLDAVLLGMATPLETAIELQPVLPIFKEIVIEPTTQLTDLTSILETWQPFVQFFVLNFSKNNITWTLLQAGQPFSVEHLTKLCEKFSLVLAIDLQPTVLKDEINMLPLTGLYVRSSKEEKIGYKSFEELDEIFDLLED